MLGRAELCRSFLVSLPTARTLVESSRLEDVAPAEPHSLSYLGHGGLVLGQVSAGQDRVQVGSLQSPQLYRHHSHFITFGKQR